MTTSYGVDITIPHSSGMDQSPVDNFSSMKQWTDRQILTCPRSKDLDARDQRMDVRDQRMNVTHVRTLIWTSFDLLHELLFVLTLFMNGKCIFASKYALMLRLVHKNDNIARSWHDNA